MSVIVILITKNVIVNLVNVIKRIKEHIFFTKTGAKIYHSKTKLNLYRRKNGKYKN